MRPRDFALPLVIAKPNQAQLGQVLQVHPGGEGAVEHARVVLEHVANGTRLWASQALDATVSDVALPATVLESSEHGTRFVAILKATSFAGLTTSSYVRFAIDQTAATV